MFIPCTARGSTTLFSSTTCAEGGCWAASVLDAASAAPSRVVAARRRGGTIASDAHEHKHTGRRAALLKSGARELAWPLNGRLGTLQTARCAPPPCPSCHTSRACVEAPTQPRAASTRAGVRCTVAPPLGWRRGALCNDGRSEAPGVMEAHRGGWRWPLHRPVRGLYVRSARHELAAGAKARARERREGRSPRATTREGGGERGALACGSRAARALCDPSPVGGARAVSCCCAGARHSGAGERRAATDDSPFFPPLPGAGGFALGAGPYPCF